MKLAFLFPFTYSRFWMEPHILLSTSTLIGNIKKYFPNIIFSQIYLDNELSFIKLKSDYKKLISLIFDDVKKHGLNVLESKNIYNKLPIFENFFKEIISHFKLNEYNHYFFSIADRQIVNFYADFLLAAYLKKKYKNKKIIFGGMYGIGDTYSDIEDLNFIDSVVLGPGEQSMRQIIGCLSRSKMLKKIYKIQVSYKDRLNYLPDFGSVSGLENFSFTQKKLENLYNIKLPESNIENKVLILPYRFSHGCFWANCAYCSGSGHKEFYYKKTDDIINDLRGLKEKYQTKYFIFFNTNFNFNLNYAKELLKKIIKNKLDILWTDSFNLRVVDNELIKLMVKAGCFRVDVGISILNPEIQKLYNNIFINKYIKNLVKISSAGIWVHINLISNLPYQYSVDEDIKFLKKYIKYINGLSLNNYHTYRYSRLEGNYDKFNLKHLKKEVKTKNGNFLLPFLENNFKGSIKKRKKIFLDNYIKLYNFFVNNNIIPNKLHFNLLAYLFNQLGFKKKEEIKKIITITSRNFININ